MTTKLMEVPILIELCPKNSSLELFYKTYVTDVYLGTRQTSQLYIIELDP